MNYLLKLLDRTTMYRTVIYVLATYILWTFLGSQLGYIYFSIFEMTVSLLLLTLVSVVTHYACKTITGAPANIESTIITVLILFFLVDPVLTTQGLVCTVLVGFTAVVSKYVLAWRKLHILNPVAFSVLVVALAGHGYATWWIANPWMFVPVVLGGLIITHKIRRFPLVISTILAGFAVFVFLGLVKEQFELQMIYTYMVAWPIIFFATVMVTEPLSTPAGKHNHIMYGLLVGALSSTPFMFGPFYSSPELALLVGNLVFYWTTIRGRIVGSLIEIKQLTRDTWEYVWSTNYPVRFKAGQYLEWSLPHNNVDQRGIRRYFSVSSAPSDGNLRMAMKIPEHASSFKKTMSALNVGDHVYATSLDGDFVLPTHSTKPIVFIAGGIGITPFASMIRQELLGGVQRNITLMYCNNTQKDIAFGDLWEEAEQKGIRVVHVISKPEKEWAGDTGYINKDMLLKHNIDLDSSMFYISGPPGMVHAYKKMLRSAQVSRSHIKTDFFPGLG